MTPPSQFRSWLPPLYVFVGVIAWDVSVLLFDGGLYFAGVKTITQHCAESPILAVELMMVAVPLHVAALVGLGLHLLVREPQDDKNIMDK